MLARGRITLEPSLPQFHKVFLWVFPPLALFAALSSQRTADGIADWPKEVPFLSFPLNEQSKPNSFASSFGTGQVPLLV